MSFLITFYRPEVFGTDMPSLFFSYLVKEHNLYRTERRGKKCKRFNFISVRILVIVTDNLGRAVFCLPEYPLNTICAGSMR